MGSMEYLETTVDTVYETGYKAGYEDGKTCKESESKEKEMYIVYDSSDDSTFFCTTKGSVNAVLAERLEHVFAYDVVAMDLSITIYKASELPVKLSFPSIKLPD